MTNYLKTFNSPEVQEQSVQLRDPALDSQANLERGAQPDATLAGLIAKSGANQTASDQSDTLQRTLAQQPHSAGQSLLQLQRRYGNHSVQRVLALAQQADGELSRDGGISSSGEVTPDVENSIQQARGGGQALDGGVRKQMEPALGADFSGVRVHTDQKADALNQSLSARAFATGQDIFFRAEAYRPGTSSGRELLAHELTHVVQQSGGDVQRKLAVSQPGDRYEEEADQVARVIMSREQQAAQAGPHGGVASRQPEEDEKTVRMQPEEGKDESAQMRFDTEQVSRQDEDEEQPVQAKFVQRQETDEEKLEKP